MAGFLEFKLKDGREITIEQFSFKTTYAATFEDSFSVEYNKNILLEIEKEAQQNFDVFYFAKPKLGDSEGMLPEAYFTAVLSSDPINEKMMGSELNLIWMGNFPTSETIIEIVKSKIEEITWVKVAQDFDL